MRLDRISLVAALAASLVLMAAPDAAQAQDMCPMIVDGEDVCVDQIGSGGKGLIGGAIIGAEIGFIIPAIIVYAGARELDEWWSWILFPLLGAVGGGVAGYFAIDEPGEDPTTGMPIDPYPEVGVAVLAISLALIVPTFVGVLAMTSYSPGGEQSDAERQGATGDEDAEDAAPPPAEEETSADQASADAIRRTLAGGPGLLRFDRGAVLLGVPMVHSTSSFTEEERRHMRLSGMADFRIPLVSGVF